MRISDWSSDVCSSDLRESVRALSADRGQTLFRRRLHCQLSAARRYHHRSDQARRRLAAGGQCRLYEVLEEIENIAVLNGHHAASSAIQYRRPASSVPDIKSSRSEERRVGKECVSTCRLWGSPY